MVAEYLPLPQRWEEHPSAIAEALGQVKTWPELLRAMKLVSAHVDVSEDALWCLATGRARPYYGRMQPLRDGLPIRDEVECRVANAVCLLIPRAEATGLWQILTALAPRMTPTSLVRLLESMRLALGATWPKGPFSLPTRHDYDHDARWNSLPRLDASAIGAALPRCRAAWTPELLVRFSLAVGASGAMVREYVYQATADDEIASGALLAQVETLGLAAMEDVDEQAAYLVGLNESGRARPPHNNNTCTYVHVHVMCVVVVVAHVHVHVVGGPAGPPCRTEQPPTPTPPPPDPIRVISG